MIDTEIMYIYELKQIDRSIDISQDNCRYRHSINKQINNDKQDNKVYSSVADPVHFFPVPVFKIRTDPGDPKKTGSGSYLDMFLMFSKINILLWDFPTKSKHLLTLKIKDYLDETDFRQFYMTRKFEFHGSFCG